MQAQTANSGRTLVNGSPLITSGGFREDFNYPNGSLPSPWVDASVQYPTMFDSMPVLDNYAAPLATHVDSLGGVTLVGHHLAYMDIGISDNFEVGVNWISDDPERLIGQIGPAAFIDPNSSNPEEMGVWSDYDVSIFNGTMYNQNVFRQTPIDWVFRSGRNVSDMVTNGTTTITSATAAFTSATDIGHAVTGTNIPASTTIASVTNSTTAIMSQAATGSGSGGTLNIAGYYISYGGSGNNGMRLMTAYDGQAPPYNNRIALRVVSGTMSMWWNGALISGTSVAVPAAYVGRTKVGFNVISAKVPVGSTGLSGNIVTTVIPEKIDNWYWRPI